MKIVLIISAFLITSGAFGQFSRQYNHYMFNGMAINPAYAGVRECLSLTGVHSSQWVGFDGAPTTQSISAHTPFRKHSGFGLNFYNDKVGVQNQMALEASYAYHLKLNRKSKLSFGMSGGLSYFQIREKSVVTINDDPAFNENFQTYSFPNIGAGMFYYRENFYAGLSVPSLFSSEYSNVSEQKYFQLRPKAMVIMQTAGAIIKVSDNLKWKPSYLVKYIPSITTDLDLNSNLYYKDLINFGASYRVKKAIVAMAGCTLLRKFDIGYSYAFPLSDIVTYSSGTHEIMLRYEFREIVQTVNPRLY